MKLLDLLAIHLTEWPEDVTHISQDGTGELNSLDDVSKLRAALAEGVEKNGEWSSAYWSYLDYQETLLKDKSLYADDYATAIVSECQWMIRQVELAADQTDKGGIYTYTLNQHDQDNDPRQMRDRIKEIGTILKELAAERESLVQGLAAEGFLLVEELDVGGVSLYGYAASPTKEDMGDSDNWKVGDLVECTSSAYRFITEGSVYKIEELKGDEGEDTDFITFTDNDGHRMTHQKEYFKWLSRP